MLDGFNVCIFACEFFWPAAAEAPPLSRLPRFVFGNWFYSSALVSTTSRGGAQCSAVAADGQTGSGKTFTMEGPLSDRGVYFLSMQELFDVITSRQAFEKTEISVSLLEIYNEQVEGNPLDEPS